MKLHLFKDRRDTHNYFYSTVNVLLLINEKTEKSYIFLDKILQ